MNQGEQRPANQLVRLVSQNAFARRADILRGAIAVENDHDLRRILQDRTMPSLALAQRVLDTFTLRDLTDDPDDADASAVVVENRAVLSGDPARFTRAR